MTLKRKTPLRRTGGPKRRSRMPRRNEERAAKRRAECFGEQADACRTMPCCVCWWGMYAHPDGSLSHREKAVEIGVFCSDPHHEPPRSCGGKDGDTVPLCREHHDERHRIGRSAFERVHGVDLRAVAKSIRDELARAKRANVDQE